MRTYDSPSLYLEQFSTIEGKITALDTIITGLLTSAAKGAESGHISEYQIDDGQSKIRTMYRSMDALYASIKNFEKLRYMYLNQLNGRGFVLRDRNSL